jgi:ankyrin repeat protein
LRRRVWIEIALAAAFAFVLFNRQDMLDSILAMSGRPGLVRILLRLGANPNSEGKGGDCLVNASYAGNLPVVKLLLAAGADPNLPSSGEETAVTQAAIEGHADVVRVLLAAGADPNGSPEYNDGMLTTAKPEIIRMLRQAGAKFYADPRIPVR